MPKPQKMPSGNWRVRVYDYTDKDGKKHYKSFTAPTKKEAMFLASEYTLDKSGSGSYEDMRLSEAYARYIKSKSEILSPSTEREYIRASKRDFPKLMNVRLSRITPELVQTAVNEMAAEVSPKSVRNAHGLLYSVLKAYRPQLVLHTSLPKKTPTLPEDEYLIPTSEEVAKLLEAADERIRVPILLASAGSLRRSEVCALTLEDVTDFGVNVTKAKVEDKNKEFVIKSTKTSAGTRFVPLSQEILKEVRAWKYFGCTPNQIEKWFLKVTEKTGIKTTFHKLRHYFASECHANGIPDKYIAKIGGWEDTGTLQKVYQHALRDKQDKFNNQVVTLFNNNLKKYDPKYDKGEKQA